MAVEIKLFLGLLEAADKDTILILDWREMKTTPLEGMVEPFNRMYAEVLDFCINEERRKKLW